MPSFMQMGHDTENLVGETELNFPGIILSPLNRYPDELKNNIGTFRDKGNYNIILDSQLYYPKSSREKLNDYPYFPSDLDTADTSSLGWWESLNTELSEFCSRLDINAVTSPIVIPKYFSDDYYDLSLQVGNSLKAQLNSSNIDVLQTIIVDISLLTKDDYILRLASILSKSSCDSFYMIFTSEIHPRNEIANNFELTGAMNLIKELKMVKKQIYIAFCSSEMILYKIAGADFCCTGKFFNLRRFTKSRFEEPAGGGGQLPYWYEQGLLAFLRQVDILRIRSKDLNSILQTGNSKNIWSDKVLQQLEEEPSKAWVGIGWRQYLSWFCKMEEDLDNNRVDVESMLLLADKNWGIIDKNKVFFEERSNNGEWVRSWLQAINDFK